MPIVINRPSLISTILFQEPSGQERELQDTEEPMEVDEDTDQGVSICTVRYCNDRYIYYLILFHIILTFK